jgi:hypothetical protein
MTLCARLSALALVLALPLGNASAARGGKARTQSLKITFDDLADDAIQSDGRGTYDGTLDSDGALNLETHRKRSLFFELSDCQTPPEWPDLCMTPFGTGGGSGEISGVSLRIPDFSGEADSASEGQATLEFVTKGQKWRITTTVIITRTADGEGGVLYSWRAPGDEVDPIWLYGARGIGPGGYFPVAWFEMPWGGTAVAP